jgi:hypothetical protein
MQNSKTTNTEYTTRMQRQIKEKDAELNELYEAHTKLEIQLSQL